MKLLDKEDKLLLVQLPFWAPLIPPQGIARIKTHLLKNGYTNIKCLDANVLDVFKNIYESYFNTIKDIVPRSKHGNFYDNGHDLMRFQFMAHINSTTNDEYFEIVKILFQIHYLHNLSFDDFNKLNIIVQKYYVELEAYCTLFIEKERPKVIGFSLHCGNFPSIVFCSRIIKKINKSIKIVTGGSFFMGEMRPNTPDFEYFVDSTNGIIDLIIVGQGENLLLRYFAGEIEDSKRVLNQSDYPQDIIKISAFPSPDLEDFDLSQYTIFPSFVSISCPNHCSFCNERTYYGDYQIRNIDKAVSELVEYHKKYNKRSFFLLDVVMNSFITEFSRKILEYDLPIYWDGYIRVSDEVADPSNTLLWRKAGYYRSRMGFESGSQKILDMMNKEITIKQSELALKSLANAGIKTTSYFVVGHPGETETDFQKTLDFIESNKDFFWQIEPHLFNYMYSGQSSENQWALKRYPVFSQKQKQILMAQKWLLDLNPVREEGLSRQIKMVEHCDKLGITNPYYVYDKYKADKRWKRLHSNSVPSLTEINDGNFVDYVKGVNIKARVEKKVVETDDFLF